MTEIVTSVLVALLAVTVIGVALGRAIADDHEMTALLADPPPGYADDGTPLTLDQAVERWLADHDVPDTGAEPVRGTPPVLRERPSDGAPSDPRDDRGARSPRRPVARADVNRWYWGDSPKPTVHPARTLIQPGWTYGRQPAREAPHRPDPTESGDAWVQ